MHTNGECPETEGLVDSQARGRCMMVKGFVMLFKFD